MFCSGSWRTICKASFSHFHSFSLTDRGGAVDRQRELILIPMNEIHHEQTPAQWLDILHMRADWEQEKPLARVVFELGQVSLEGDPEFLARLEQGIPDETDQLIFPKDGMRFLLAVQSYFS